MSIFKETLPDYIKDQLKVRETIIQKGTSDKFKAEEQRAKAGMIDIKLNPNRFEAGGFYRPSDGAYIVVDPGAFYTNTLNKSCTIRMASLVDLSDESVLGEPMNESARLVEKTFGGPGMALTYILEGGTVIKGARKNQFHAAGTEDPFTGEKFDKNIRRIDINTRSVLRRGFPKAAQLLGGVYGDPIVRADAGRDGYGIVPMPGITSANIKTKSAYGSLREAKVKFECHNLRQLEILELLYMRPGFPILLEWGWNVYVNNDGMISSAPEWISEDKEFWDAGIVTQEGLAHSIINKRKDSGGNQDGLLGFVKNFSFKARKDGGFSCTTELMGVGEVMNSIKGTMITQKRKDNTREDIPKIMYLLNQMVDGIIGLAGGSEQDNTGDTFDDPDLEKEMRENHTAHVKGEIDPGGTATYGDSSDPKTVHQIMNDKDGISEEHVRGLKDAYNLKSFRDEQTALIGREYKHTKGAQTGTLWHTKNDGDLGDKFVEAFMLSKGWELQKGQGALEIPEAQKSYNPTLNPDPKPNDWPGMDEEGTWKYNGRTIKSWADVYDTDRFVAVYAFDRSAMNNIHDQKEWDGMAEEATDFLKDYAQELDHYWDEGKENIANAIRGKATNKVVDNKAFENTALDFGVHVVGPEHDETKKGKSGKKLKGLMGYIRLDAFCHILNSIIIPKNTKNDGKIMSFQTNHLSSTTNQFDSYKFNSYEDKFYGLFKNKTGINLDISTDPYTCLMSEQVADLSSETNVEFYRPILDTYGYGGSDLRKIFYNNWPIDADGITDDEKKRANRSVGHLYLNLDMLHDLCKKLQKQTKNEHFSLGEFMSQILEKCNNAMGGNHKLGLVVNSEFPNVVNIVDLNGDLGNKSYEAITKINVGGNHSVVRDWSFNTQLPSAMASTIAVMAQNPNSANALDEVTFAALNRGIRNRLYRPGGTGTSNYTQDELDKKQAQLKKEVTELGNKLARLKEYNDSLLERDFNEDDAKDDQIANHRSTLLRAQGLIDIIGTKDEKGVPKQNPPSSTPIPIKLDMVFDGIGGLIIGHTFRVDDTRLPSHYRASGKDVNEVPIGKNLLFLINSEEQKISAKGDWTTKIQGMMQLFPEPLSDLGMANQMKESMDIVTEALNQAAVAEENEKQKREDLIKKIEKEADEEASYQESLQNTLELMEDVMDDKIKWMVCGDITRCWNDWMSNYAYGWGLRYGSFWWSWSTTRDNFRQDRRNMLKEMQAVNTLIKNNKAYTQLPCGGNDWNTSTNKASRAILNHPPNGSPGSPFTYKRFQARWAKSDYGTTDVFVRGTGLDYSPCDGSGLNCVLKFLECPPDILNNEDGFRKSWAEYFDDSEEMPANFWSYKLNFSYSC